MRHFFQLLPFFLCAVALICAVQRDPFFWDTVQLASKHARYFYDNGLRWAPLPPEIDSGHPPVFGYYLAHVWVILGKTLPASHWAMLPFLLLNVWLLFRLGKRFGGNKLAFWLIPLAWLDPVMAGQSVLVSPDVALVCFFLFAVEGLSGRNVVFTTIGITGLCMISLRGMMTAGALFSWQVLQLLLSCRPFTLRVLMKRVKRSGADWHWVFFLPGFAFAAWFLWWHHAATGWTGLHSASPWTPAFEPAKGMGLLRNLLVIGWRWLDFGRVFEWVALGWLAWKMWALRREFPESLKPVVLLFACLLLFLSPSALLLKNISAHRYFLPGFLVLHLLVFQLFVACRPALSRSARTAVLPFLTVLFAFGNCWIYPHGIAMGWDATLAHLPYHRLRAESLAYLKQENIDFQTVGSAFPNLNSGENLSLDGDRRRFADKDFSKNTYIFASNIFNDFSEEDYAVLRRDWVLLKKWQHGGVWLEIYRRNL